MPPHMFQDLVSSRAKTSRKWYTLPLSFVVHTSLLAVLVVVPLMATDVLPTPRSVLEFVVVPAIPSLPAAPPRILRSVPLLDQAALDAVRSWEYTPTLLNGRPTPVIMTVTVRFTLNN
jgi:hypothetical protein